MLTEFEFEPTPFCMRRGAELQADQGAHLFEALAEFVRDPA